MQNTWEKARELGFKEGELNALLRQLRIRFGELPAAAVARIQAAGTAELRQWADRVLSAKTLAEVLDEPSDYETTSRCGMQFSNGSHD